MGREGLDALLADFIEEAVDLLRDLKRGAVVLADHFGVLGLSFSLAGRGGWSPDLGEFYHALPEWGPLQDEEAEDGTTKVTGAPSGIVPIKEDGEGLIDKVADAEGPHLNRDDEEEEDAGLGCDEVEGGEDAEDTRRGADHWDLGGVALKEAGDEEEDGVEKGTGHTAEKVEDEEDAGAHPALDVRAEEKEADPIHDEVAKVSVEKLKGEEAPELETREAFLDTEVAEVLEENAVSGASHEDLEKEDSNIDDDEPLRDGCAFEGAGHTGWAAALLRLHVVLLHVVSILNSHVGEIAVNGES